MFAVLHLPQFALQAALRPAPELWTRPIALVDPMLTMPRVCDLTEPARRQGVEIGQTPTQALARCREVAIRHRSLAQETAATDAILQCAHGFSPHIEQTALGVVTLDLRGLSELLDDRLQTSAGETRETLTDPAREVSPLMQRWAGRLQSALTSLHLTARLGLGPTPNIARHAAQWGSGGPEQLTATSLAAPDLRAPCIVTDVRTFIAALPVAALDPSTDVAGILEKWGVRTVGQLLALGQDAVMDRLGLEAIALFAAAAPQTTRPLNLVRPTERYEESFEFEQEVETVEPLLFILNRFVEQISQRLEHGSLAAEQLTLRLRLVSDESLEHRLRVPQPTRRADVLFRMLQTHLESVRTNSPIAGVTLQADPTRPGQKQFSLFEAALRDPYQFQETLARLSALVGADRVGTPVRENSHRPDAFKLIPPDFENAPNSLRRHVAEILRHAPLRRLRPPMPATVERGLQAASSTECSSSPESWMNPLMPLSETSSRTLSKAEMVDKAYDKVSDKGAPAANTLNRYRPEGPAPADPDLLSLRCQLARGRITVALGPWRASGHWWEPGDAGAWQRDEWDVQIQDGPALRLVQSGERWHVEAIVD